MRTRLTRRAAVKAISAVPLVLRAKASLSQNESIDEWSWIPSTASHDLEVAKIPHDATVRLSIPQDRPLATRSNGWARIDIYSVFQPLDKAFKPLSKDIYAVLGGDLVTDLGDVKKTASFGSWDFVQWDDSSPYPYWSHSLTSGEVILPNKTLLRPNDLVSNNFYAVEKFGPQFILITIDPSKGHRLTWLKIGRLQIPTPGFIGSKAEIAGKIYECRREGWYLGEKRVWENAPTGRFSEYHKNTRLTIDAGFEMPTGARVVLWGSEVTPDNPLSIRQDFELPVLNPATGVEEGREHVSRDALIARNADADPKALCGRVRTDSGDINLFGTDNLIYKINRDQRWGTFGWQL